MSDTSNDTGIQSEKTSNPDAAAQTSSARWTIERGTLNEKLQIVSDQSGGDQIRMIELLLAENVWLQSERLVSMHRGQSPDFTTIERFLADESST